MGVWPTVTVGVLGGDGDVWPSSSLVRVEVLCSYTMLFKQWPPVLANPPSRPLPFLVSPQGHLETPTKKACSPPHHPTGRLLGGCPLPHVDRRRGAFPPPPIAHLPSLPYPPPPSPRHSLFALRSWSAGSGHYLAAMVATKPSPSPAPPHRGAHSFSPVSWSARLLGQRQARWQRGGEAGLARGGEGAKEYALFFLCRFGTRSEWERPPSLYLDAPSPPPPPTLLPARLPFVGRVTRNPSSRRLRTPACLSPSRREEGRTLPAPLPPSFTTS